MKPFIFLTLVKIKIPLKSIVHMQDIASASRTFRQHPVRLHHAFPLTVMMALSVTAFKPLVEGLPEG